MKITLIRPNIGRLENDLFIDEARMEPLALGVIAALTPPEVEVVMYDDRLEPIPFDDPTDLVAISVEIFTARRAYEISRTFRERGVPVILGGVHVTLLPEEAAHYADSIYIGDAEMLWGQVVSDLQNNMLRPVYRSQGGPPQPGRLTRRDIYQGKKYLPISLVQFSRGCRFACEFCAVSSYFKAKHFCRSVVETIHEIENQPRKHIFFVDDNLIADHQAAKELFRALIPLNIHWVSQASIDMTEDPELMTLMAESGCLGNVIGFESIVPDNLSDMGKKTNITSQIEPYSHQIEILRQYGLQTWAAFTLGHDHDTPESIQKLLDFALKNKFTFAAFQPALMSADELTQMGFHCRKVFNSLKNVLWRALEPNTNMGSLYRFAIYAVYSRLFRQETFKKHGMRLGMGV